MDRRPLQDDSEDMRSVPRLVSVPELASNHYRPYVKERHAVVYRSPFGSGKPERPGNLGGFPERGHERPRRNVVMVQFLRQLRLPCRASDGVSSLCRIFYLLESFPRTSAVLVIRRALWVGGYYLLAGVHA